MDSLALAAALAAGALMLSACSATDARSSDVASQTTSVAIVAPCPAWDAEPAYADGELPEGATTLRVCSGDDPEVEHWSPAVAPFDTLTTGLDDLTTLVNDLPDWVPPDGRFFCSQEHKPAINYVFGYPDGSTRSVTYGYGDCGLLELERPDGFPEASTHAKADPTPLFGAVNVALLEQRRSVTPPPQRFPEEKCEPGSPPLTVLPQQGLTLSQASLCLPADRSRVSRIPIPRTLLDRLEDAYATVIPLEDVPTCHDRRTASVVGTSTWGDPMLLYVQPCDSFLLGFTPDLQTFSFALPPGLADDLFALAPRQR